LADKNAQQLTVAVVGGGSWATALVKILAEGNVKVNWWIRNPKDVKHIKTYTNNPRYLSNIQFNLRKVKPSSDLGKVLEDASYAILAVPAAFISEVLSELSPSILKEKTIVSAIKGMIPEQNLLVSDFMEKKFGIKTADQCIIAGPCHSEEIAMEKRSYLTIGGSNEVAGDVASLLSCRYVKTSVIDDLYGLEYCAIMKNIIAIASGVAKGLSYGDNFQAVLVANAMQEIKRFVEKLHPLKGRDMDASAYLGDLLVTAYSQFSRNRTLGNMVGQGYSVRSAQMEMKMVAEGYYAVKSIYEINNKYNVEMPVTRTVYNILYEKISPAVEMKILEDKLK
jgi:glycerol-3-phosphate dehydrogenase (NAD(P)+)